MKHGMKHYFTPAFVEGLRTGSRLFQTPVQFRPGPLSVAMHVRRGDASGMLPRSVSNRWYLSAAQELRKLDADADVHVFTALEGNSDSMGDFRRANMTVHLDGDVLQPLVHMG